MNSIQNIVSTDNVGVELCCRVCLQLEDLMVHIYDGGAVEDFQSDLITLLERCGGIKVETYDNLPKFLCKDCTNELLVAAKFREKCERTQLLLAEFNWKELKEPILTEWDNARIENGPLSNVENAAILSDIENNLTYPQDLIEVDLEETIVEDRLTVSSSEDCVELTENGEKIFEVLSENDRTETDDKEKVGVIYYETLVADEFSSNPAFEEMPKKNIINRHKPNKDFKCDTCGAVFVQPSNLQRHLEKVHSVLQPYRCKSCNYCFSSEDPYKNHSVYCTKSKVSTYLSNQRKCTYCCKSFQSAFSLNMHLRTHTGERPFKCTHCPKAFKTQSAVSMHIKRHSNKPDLMCSICHKSFFEKSNLNIHMRTHTGEKPHSCSLCKKSFSRVFLLQSHMRTHTGEKPYQCPTCNRSFAQLCDLRYHERTHTGERKYKCTFCDKAFIKRCTLKSHLQRHSALQSEDENILNKVNVETVESNIITQKADDDDNSIQYVLENSMLEGGDGLFFSKIAEEFCDLTYEEVTPLSEESQDLAWSNFHAEEI